jgi:class 3 adenylate cyclase/tetratricopeptide (TPR) repeat protein
MSILHSETETYTLGVNTCSQCGEANVDRAKFCLNCGAPLVPEVGASRERKLVSVLFVDLDGFTSRSDNADPEDVREMLETYYERAREQVERRGGALEKFIGDAVMAVFGAPVSHGDDAERAVRAGLDVLSSIEELNRSRPGLDLEARAAVNTGEAVVAIGSRRESPDALALGDVVNTAARLQTSAPPGGLIVGEETYRATRRVIEYRRIPPIKAKGKSEPVTAWLALGPSAGAMQRPEVTSALVGRNREMALLRSVWERAVAERQPHLVTVVGPPGIGKSRLGREICSLVEDWGYRAFVGRCLPYETSDVYGAFAQQIRRLAGIVEQDPPEAKRAKLAVATERLVGDEEAPEITRSLSLLLGLGLDEPVDERPLLFFSARRFVEQLCLEQPTLLVFEDIHWASAGELDLIEHLAGRTRDTALTLLALTRPELLDVRTGWGSGQIASTTVVLEPLPASAASKIAARWVGEDVPNEQIDRLVQIAEGNPLFVEELAASVAEGIPPGGELPTTVRVAIASRIDALPPDERATLLDASVVGKVFWRGALQALDHENVGEVLEALEARDLVRREPTSGMRDDAQYAFKHVLIRDVAYGTLPRPDRRSRHAAVARYLEGTAKEQVRDVAWLLAHHWREAGEPDRAIDYLVLAAEKARDSWATEEAIRLYDDALDLATDERLRVHLRLLRGLALVRLEEYERAVNDLGELLPELERLDELEAVLARGRAAQWTEQTGLTIEMAERAVALAESLDARELLGPARARLSQAYAMRGGDGDLDRAKEVGDRALDIWVPEMRTDELAEHNAMHADVYYWRGDFSRTLELSRAARELAVDSGSREALMRGGGGEALALVGMGRYEEALAVFEQRIAFGREMGRPVRVLLNYSTMALRELYDLDEARSRNEEALEQRGWSSFNMPWLNSSVDLVFTDILAGDVGSAENRWPSVWDDVRNGQGWQQWLLTGKMTTARAQIAVLSGDHEEAIEWATKAIDMAARVHRKKYEMLSRITLGQALLGVGRTSDGVAELATAVGEADQLGSPSGRWQARSAYARALLAVGRDDEAGTTFSAAVEIINDVASGLAPGRAERLLSAEPIREVLEAGAS